MLLSIFILPSQTLAIAAQTLNGKLGSF